MQIYLIRHGLTKANELNKYLGHQNISLSNRGILQLKQIDYNINYDYLFASPLKRCMETANILFDDIPLTIDEFKELNFGDFDGYTYEQLKSNSNYQSWLNDIENYPIPNGEVVKDFKQRVISKYTEITTNSLYKNKTVVIITHGGVIKTIIGHITNKSFFDITTPFGKGYLITIKNQQESVEIL